MQGSITGESPARIPVDIRRMAEMNALAGAYAYDFASLAPFYSGNPAAFRSWAEAIERVRVAKTPRTAIADVLVAQQQRFQAPARAIDAARLLADPRSVAIVTGQQAGLFG